MLLEVLLDRMGVCSVAQKLRVCLSFRSVGAVLGIWLKLMFGAGQPTA